MCEGQSEEAMLITRRQEEGKIFFDDCYSATSRTRLHNVIKPPEKVPKVESAEVGGHNIIMTEGASRCAQRRV